VAAPPPPIIIRPVHDGGAFGEYGEGYLRISYANYLSNIQEALDRIRKASPPWAS
jgi:aspartate/methionine/tyrosine aminotransferase